MAEAKSSTRKLGRKLSRRLSLVTKMPNLIGSKLKSDFGSRDSLVVRRDRRLLEITVIAPDKTQRIMYSRSPETVCGMISMLLAEYCVVSPRLTLAGSSAEVDPTADVALLEGDVLIVEEGFWIRDRRGDVDPRYRVCEEWSRDEERYVEALRSTVELYGYPLRRSGALTPQQYQMIFEPTATLASACAILLHQMKNVLLTWDSRTSTVGDLFSRQWWTQYEEYQDLYRRTRQFLRDKTAADDDFPELCKLRRGAAKYSLPALLHLPEQIPGLDYNFHDGIQVKPTYSTSRCAP